MNTQLLCLFTTKEELDKSVDFILTNYTLTNPNVFILESKVRPEEAFITFNVEKGSNAIPSEWKTILVHRKKQSNTLYTINALNELVKEENGGKLDKSFEIDWEKFRNTIIVTNTEGTKKLSTRIFEVIETSETISE